MASVFKIRFTPEVNKDYNHELVCMTEREKFVVPVKAIGARAILDFPDEINFGQSPVKHEQEKVILVRNIGNDVAKYCFKVEELVFNILYFVLSKFLKDSKMLFLLFFLSFLQITHYY